MSDRVEIVGPFKEYRLVINGWLVPLMEAREVDGGEVWLTVDGRMALVVSAEMFEQVACFIADVIGTCWGYGAHPRPDEFFKEAGLPNPFDDPATAFADVPHRSLSPHRVHEIAGVRLEDGADPDGEA